MGFFSSLFGGGSSSNDSQNQDLANQLYPHEKWCSRCQRCDIMPGGDGYYCKGTGSGNPYNDVYQEMNSTGSIIIGYTPDDINRPCCYNGQYFIPDNQYDVYQVKYSEYLTKSESY